MTLALTEAGHGNRLGPPATSSDLAAREELLGAPLPPSYLAAIKESTRTGDPEVLLLPEEIEIARATIARMHAADAERYFPFARARGSIFVFDRVGGTADGELSVVEWHPRSAVPRAANFADWLDAVADAREESIRTAVSIPPRLRMLLGDLGFRFDYPLVGRLETGDIAAIEELIGPKQTGVVRADVDRIFDSSGRASLTLNLDEFSLAVSLRTGIYIFEAEDVFRWLRYFRDENFFGESNKEPSHPDNVRDLRRAPREPTLVRRGIHELSSMPAQRHSFRSASGLSDEDFYLLGRTGSTRDRSPSLILHVVRGQVKEAHALDEPLNDLHVTADGTLWGLSNSGAAIRFDEGSAMTFPLQGPTGGRTWWYGIGGSGDRVLVWGTGALLELRGKHFLPFAPDHALGPTESVVNVYAQEEDTKVLIVGDRRGAVAHSNGASWLPITAEDVVEGPLVDFDVWRSTGVVLDRDEGAFRIGDGPPRRLPWNLDCEAFRGEDGRRRPMYGLCLQDDGALVASDGGVLVIERNEPTFHTAVGASAAAHLARLGASGDRDARAGAAGIVVTLGPHAWVWRNGSFHVLDVREW